MQIPEEIDDIFYDLIFEKIYKIRVYDCGPYHLSRKVRKVKEFVVLEYIYDESAKCFLSRAIQKCFFFSVL